MHRRARFKKHFSREELNRGIAICRSCHKGIHRLYDEMTLATRLNSLEAIKEDPTLANHFAWVARQRESID